MPLNSTGIDMLCDALQATLAFAQIHSAAAGLDGTENIAAPARQPLYWELASGGVFGLASQLRFSGGTGSSAVHSVTVWDAETDGTCYGEFPLSDGDDAFSPDGVYLVTAIDFTGTASDA